MIRVQFANIDEADKFVAWILSKDDIPYIAMTDGLTEYVIMFHLV